MRVVRATKFLLLSLLLWSGWACTETLISVVDVASVEIDPPAPAMSPGESLQLTARLKDAAGNTLSGRAVQWSSTSQSIATISATGMVLGVATGSATIIATSEGVQGSTQVTIGAAPVITTAPDSVPLSAILGESDIVTAAVTITNTGGGTLAGLSAAIEYDEGTATWLDAELSGVLAPATLALTADASGLTRGTHRATIRLTAASTGAAPAVVRVILDVHQRTAAPTLVSVTPDRSTPEQSLSVIMTGSNFVPGLTAVDFGSGITVNSVTVDGPTTLTAGITVGASAAAGQRDVTVTNPPPGGGSAVLAGGFTVEGLNPRPTVTTIEPASAQQQSTLDVQIHGTGFLDGITIADFGTGITINSVEVANATTLLASITITAGASPGARDVTVVNPEPGGGVGTLRSAFTVLAANPAPTLLSVAPASAQRLTSVGLVLTGTQFATGLTSIDFGAGITVSDVVVTNAATITADITVGASAALGARAVSVTNAGPGGGTATLDAAFTVLDAHPAPSISTIVPARGRSGDMLDVAIVGSGFVSDMTTLDFGAGVTVADVSVTSSTALTATIAVAADAIPGARSITITNPAPGGGAATLADAFVVVGAASADLSTVTAAPSSNVAADGAAYARVTITVRDVAGSPVSGLASAAFDVTVTGSATAGAIAESATPGTYVFSVANTVAETVTVSVAVEGVELEDQPQIGFVATVVSAANSSVAAAPQTGIPADGVAASIVTVVLRDPNDNALAGLPATAFAIGVSGSAVAGAVTETMVGGTYSFTVTNTVAEQVTVTVSAGGTALNQEPGITFVPGGGSAARSTAVVPGGTAGLVTTLAITVRDANDNPVSGAAGGIIVVVTGANAATPAVSDNGDGTYAASYTPVVAGQDNVAITIGGEALPGSPFASTVVAGAVSASVSTVAAEPTNVVANGTAASTVTVAVRDAFGNVIAGLGAADFEITAGGATAGPIAATATAGSYAFTVSHTVSGAVTAIIRVRGVTLAQQPTITFMAGGPSAANSTVSAAPASGVTADGVAASSVTVNLRDGSGNAIAGLPVAQLVITLSGTGASAGMIMETAEGTYSFAVTSTVAQTTTVTVQAAGVTLTQRPTITFVAGVATQLAVSAGDGQSAPVGTPVSIAPSVIVRDATGNPVSDEPVTFAVTSGGGSLSTSGVVSTNAAGIATSPTWTLGSVAGSNTLTATSSGLEGSPVTFTASATAGAATQLSITTQPSAAARSGSALAQQPVIQLRDGSGNAVAEAGVIVSAAIASGGGTLGGTLTATTDAAGSAAFADLSIAGIVGARTLDFSAAGVAVVTSDVVMLSAGDAAQMALSAGGEQSATVGTVVGTAPSVLVTDASGNPVAGIPVVFAVATGGGSLAADGATVSNVSGIATSPAWTLGMIAGVNTLSATSTGLSGSPVTFTATGTSGDATRMAIITQPSETTQSGAVFARQPSVQILDDIGNAVAEAGVVVTATIASGGGTLGGTVSTATNADGIATFTNLSITGAAGDRTLQLGAGGIAPVVSGTIAVAAGAATQLGITTQPSAMAQSGVAFVQQPVIRLLDGGGNAATTPGVVVTVAIASGGGVLSGTSMATTDVDGIATFNDLSISGIAGTRTLSFAAAGLTSAVSTSIAVSAGTATQMAANSGNGQSAPVGTPVPFAPSVIVRDASGNPVAGWSVTFAVTAGDGALAASGTVMTGPSGIAISPAWTLGEAAGVNTLTATATGLAGSPIEFTATGTPGDVAQLTITAQPAASAQSGVTLDPQPIIQLRDEFGNPVPDVAVAIVATIASGGGTLGGTTTALTDAAGAATFSDLMVTGLAGDRTLRFAVGAVSVVSNAIAITAGVPTQIAIDAGNGQSATVGTPVSVPPSVIVADASGNPVAGASVTFAIGLGGGSLASTDAVLTNAGGIATSPAWTLGTVVGPNTLTATSDGLAGSPVTFTATGIAGEAAALRMVAQPSATAPSGAAFVQQPAVQLIDGTGNAVAEAGVVISAGIATGGGALGGVLTASTDAAGLATFTDLSITGLIGDYTLEFSSTGLTSVTSSAIAITTGSAASIALNDGDGQSATAGSTVAEAPSVIVTDGGGNPVAGVSVTFAIGSGGGSLASTDPVLTNASGVATSPAWTLGTAVGENTVVATSGALMGSPVTFTATGTAGDAAALVIATEPPTSIASGAVFAPQPAVQLQDANGNVVAEEGVTITATIEGGGGALGGVVTASTDADGTATFADLSITGLIGDYTLEFSSTGLTSATSAVITITTGSPDSIAIHAGDNQSATAGTAVAEAPSVIVTDAGGNPVAGASVTFAIGLGNGSLTSTDPVLTNTAGIAASPAWTLGPTAGTNTLTATSGVLAGSPVTFTATGTVGNAAALRIVTQPSSTAPSGATFAQQPVIQLIDATGNHVASAGVTITAAIATVGGALGGVLTATTTADGIATFTDLSITGLIGDYTLEFSSPGLTSVTSSAITITTGSAASIAINDGDAQEAAAGSAVAVPPSVIVTDAGGNPVAGASVTFAVASGEGSLADTGVIQTGADGIATAPAWTLGATAGPNTLTATSDGLAGSPVTFTATGTASAGDGANAFTPATASR